MDCPHNFLRPYFHDITLLKHNFNLQVQYRSRVMLCVVCETRSSVLRTSHVQFIWLHLYTSTWKILHVGFLAVFSF